MEYFYYSQLVTYRKLIYYLFDNIKIESINEENKGEDNLRKIQVGLTTMSKLYTFLNKNDTNFNVQRPFISIIPESMSHDPEKERQAQLPIHFLSNHDYQRSHRYSKEDEYLLSPKPYKHTYKVIIIGEDSYRDVDQIVEQIVPEITPSIDLSFNHPVYPVRVTSKIITTNADYNNNLEWSNTDEKTIRYDIDLEQEIYIFRRKKEYRPILNYEVNIDQINLRDNLPDELENEVKKKIFFSDLTNHDLEKFAEEIEQSKIGDIILSPHSQDIVIDEFKNNAARYFFSFVSPTKVLYYDFSVTSNYVTKIPFITYFSILGEKIGLKLEARIKTDYTQIIIDNNSNESVKVRFYPIYL